MTASEPAEPPPAEVEPVEDVPWRGLHPLSLLVNLLPRAWRVVRGMWPLFLAVFLQGRRDTASVLDLAIVSLFVLSSIGGTVVHFLTLRYRVVGGRLEIRSGLVNRQVRAIDPERIQNVELVRTVFHKLAGLVEVRLETASGREVEGLLSALSEDHGAELIAALGRARRHRPSRGTPPEVLLASGIPDLLRYGATGMRFGAGLAIVLGLAMEALQWLGPRRIGDVPGGVGPLGVGLLAVAFLSGLFVVAVATAVLRFWNFELLQIGDRLVAASGLLTRRRVEVPLEKVQLVMVREPLLRRLLSFGTVLVETAAARERSGGTITAEAVVPVVHADEIGDLVGRVVPSEAGVWDRPLRRPHPLALKRGLVGAAVRGAIFGGALAAWWWPWGLVTVPLLVGWGLVGAWFDFRHQGWRLTDRVLLARRGFMTRQTGIVRRDKVQSVEVRQGPLLRRWGLGRVVVRVAGSALSLPLVGEAEALALLEALRPPVGGGPGPGLRRAAGPEVDPDGEGADEDHPPQGRRQGDDQEQADGEEAEAGPAAAEEPPDAPDALEKPHRPGDPDRDERRAGDHREVPVEAGFPRRVEPGLDPPQARPGQGDGGEEAVEGGDEDAGHGGAGNPSGG